METLPYPTMMGDIAYCMATTSGFFNFWVWFFFFNLYNRLKSLTCRCFHRNYKEVADMSHNTPVINTHETLSQKDTTKTITWGNTKNSKTSQRYTDRKTSFLLNDEH